MIEKTKYEKKYWYPNMREAETLIWERFLLANPEAYDEVAYNVKVGEGADIPDGTDEKIADGFKQLTQHKIDVVGFKNEKVDIIELKAGSNTSAVGQILKYEKLFKKTYGNDFDLGLVIITDNTSRDLETTLEGEEIKLIVI